MFVSYLAAPGATISLNLCFHFYLKVCLISVTGESITRGLTV